MKRVVILIMDSFGIGAADDAADFSSKGVSDVGSNTLGNIARYFGEGKADTKDRQGPLSLPNLNRLGLGHACYKSSGYWPEGLDRDETIEGAYAVAKEISSGKDTPSGHWEIACCPVLFDWSYFPDIEECFPKELLLEIYQRCGLDGSLGHCHASGTEIIARLGEEHLKTGYPIFYTSADSVFQIACSEESFGLQRLIALCEEVRKILDESSWNIGRVIARPFVGNHSAEFSRTGNRHDYSVRPPSETLFERIVDHGGTVVGVGKIGDIYAHTGMSQEIRASGHDALWRETLSALDAAGDQTTIITNFVDFDAVYGHRRDVLGYGRSLEEFDARLSELYRKMGREDLLIITADHGNDPTWGGTDHTREHVPVLLRGAEVQGLGFLGVRETFSDIGATVLDYWGLPVMKHGQPMFLKRKEK